MHQENTQPPVFFVLILSLGVLVASILILIPNPTNSPRQEIQSLSRFPTLVSLDYHGIRYATTSASLISTQSRERYTYIPSWREIYFPLFSPPPSIPSHPFDPALLQRWIQSLASQIDSPAILPSARLLPGKKISIFPGKMGQKVAIDETVENIMNTDFSATESAILTVVSFGNQLSATQIQTASESAAQFIGKTITITSPHISRKLETGDILALLDLPSSFSTNAIDDLANILDMEVGTKPIEPELIISEKEVEKFIAPRDGKNIDRAHFQSQLIQRLHTLKQSSTVEPLTLSFILTPPKKSLAETNTLGISERIGIGESAYSHSIPNRVHNVSLTTSRIHGKLISPGEEFSFNEYLGEVSAKTGFKPAYVIKQGQTVLGDGGGVCQVSSTLFRAVLNSGLPITERKGHSYRVSYYEENSRPGFDATVYSPHPDFRFVNDTAHPILINAVADPKTLTMYVELWGTHDGRKAEIKNYRQWGATSAPPPVYQDDSTLPKGKLKQIDYAAPGLHTAFDSVVSYPDGSARTKTYTTTYVPWRAVYLRGI